MSTKTIKFSYPFSKLFYNNSLIDCARLMQMVQIDLSDISQELLDYDTDFGKYKLPKKGAYLMLLFKHPSGALFTTLRRETPEKLDYYRRSVGFMFDLDVNHDVKTEE